MSDKKLISIVIPVYNEEPNIDNLIPRIAAVADSLLDKYDFEFIFTDNCSEDNTFGKLAEWAEREKRIRVFRFSRNFGFQRSILTGFLKTRGEAAIQLDADLQDPPELIPEMLEKWEEGYEVVYGIRRKRKESLFLNLGRKFYYWLVDAISDEMPVARDAGDFRLISSKVINVLRNIRGNIPYIRGTIAEIGFAQTGIPYDRDARTEGESKFRPLKLISFALDGLVHQSTLPLRLSAFFGMGVGLAGIVFIGVLLFRYFVAGEDWPAGFATLSILIMLTMMMNAFFFAIIGEYIGRLYGSNKGMPVSVVDQVIEPPQTLSSARQTETISLE